MSFASLPEFFAMGGHAAYVWSAWAIGLVIVAWNITAPMLARTSTRHMLAEWIRTDERRRGANPTSDIVDEEVE